MNFENISIEPIDKATDKAPVNHQEIRIVSKVPIILQLMALTTLLL